MNQKCLPPFPIATLSCLSLFRVSIFADCTQGSSATVVIRLSRQEISGTIGECLVAAAAVPQASALSRSTWTQEESFPITSASILLAELLQSIHSMTLQVRSREHDASAFTQASRKWRR